MKFFTDCEVCGKQGQPIWVSGGGHQASLQQASLQQAMQAGQIQPPAGWVNPPGWNDVLGKLLCDDCCGRVREIVRDMAQPPREK